MYHTSMAGVGGLPGVDMRSDTVTRPSLGMRRVMAEAEVGHNTLGDRILIVCLFGSL